MRSITEGHRLGLFAGAPGDGFLFRDFGFQGAEAGSFVRAVAKRLAFGTPASAPPISPRLDELDDGRFLKYNWVGHAMVVATMCECSKSKDAEMQMRKKISRNIPKGLRHSAQRCRDAVGATLGGESQIGINPERVEPNCEEMGTAMQPRWG